MKLKFLLFTSLFIGSVAVANQADLKPLIFESKYDFRQTVTMLEETLKSKGMPVFAKIDHQSAAKQVGMEMQPATVIVYGNLKIGTSLMAKDSSLALQLPLKVLVTESKKGMVEVMLNTADQQVVAHSDTAYSEVENNLANAEKLIKATVAK